MEKLGKKLSSFLPARTSLLGWLPLSSCIGFTLIELLTIIGIMAVLSAILFGSQYAIREQIFLFQDQSKISNLINEAKNLTLGAFQRERDVCGYGVSFESINNGVDNWVVLYKDKKGTDSNCIEGHKHEYNSDVDEKISESSFELNKTEKFSFIDGVSKYAVVFNAPSLTAFLTKNDENILSTDNNIVISLQAIKSGVELKIKINQFGQVVTE